MAKVIMQLAKVGDALTSVFIDNEDAHICLVDCLAWMRCVLGIETSIHHSICFGDRYPKDFHIMFEGRVTVDNALSNDPHALPFPAMTFKRWETFGLPARVQGFITGWFMAKRKIAIAEPPQDFAFDRNGVRQVTLQVNGEWTNHVIICRDDYIPFLKSRGIKVAFGRLTDRKLRKKQETLQKRLKESMYR